MTEFIEPGVLETPQPRRKLRVRWSDVSIFAGIIVVVALLGALLLNKLTSQHDIASGKVVADQLVGDIAKRDGTAARKLGSSTFQATYTASQLTTQFEAIEPVTSHARTVDRQTLSHGKAGKTVFIIYKYPTKDLAFYIRVSVTQNSKTGQWQLTNITGTANESDLITD